MGILDTIKNIAKNRSEKSEKFKQLQEEDKLQSMLEERKKSANRRELERFYKEEEEKEIQEALKKIRKDKNKNAWKGDFLKGEKNMSKNERPILKEKNIFSGSKMPNLKGGMFFK